jgi:hypothetical protein
MRSGWPAQYFKVIGACGVQPMMPTEERRSLAQSPDLDVIFHPDTNKWQHLPPVYTDMSVKAASNTALDWVNAQLQFDASGKQYAPIP